MLLAFDKHNTLMAEAQEGKGLFTLFAWKVLFLYPHVVCNCTTIIQLKQNETGTLLETKLRILN